MSKVSCKVRSNGRTFELAVGESILHAAMAQGVELDHECIQLAQKGDELDQLDEARDVGLDSRLGCQAKLLRAPAGGTVEITIPSWNVNAVREGGH